MDKKKVRPTRPGVSANRKDALANLPKMLDGIQSTQEGIQTLSLWIIHHKDQSRDLVKIWLKAYKNAKTGKKLSLFYLANDVIQNCKKKQALVFQDDFARYLKHCMRYSREEKSIHPNVTRVLKIWEERKVYEKEFLKELRDVMESKQSSVKPKSEPSKPSEEVKALVADFKAKNMIEELEQHMRIVGETKLKLNQVVQSDLDPSDDNVSKQIKDRTQKDEFLSKLSVATHIITDYVAQLEQNIEYQKKFVPQLEKCELFYDIVKSDSKVVVNAYKKFAHNISQTMKKLDNSRDKMREGKSKATGEDMEISDNESNSNNVTASNNNNNNIEEEASTAKAVAKLLNSNKSIFKDVDRPASTSTSPSPPNRGSSSRKRKHKEKKHHHHRRSSSSSHSTSKKTYKDHDGEHLSSQLPSSSKSGRDKGGRLKSVVSSGSADTGEVNGSTSNSVNEMREVLNLVAAEYASDSPSPVSGNSSCPSPVGSPELNLPDEPADASLDGYGSLDSRLNTILQMKLPEVGGFSDDTPGDSSPSGLGGSKEGKPTPKPYNPAHISPTPPPPPPADRHEEGGSTPLLDEDPLYTGGSGTTSKLHPMDFLSKIIQPPPSQPAGAAVVDEDDSFLYRELGEPGGALDIDHFQHEDGQVLVGKNVRGKWAEWKEAQVGPSVRDEGVVGKGDRLGEDEDYYLYGEDSSMSNKPHPTISASTLIALTADPPPPPPPPVTTQPTSSSSKQSRPNLTQIKVVGNQDTSAPLYPRGGSNWSRPPPPHQHGYNRPRGDMWQQHNVMRGGGIPRYSQPRFNQAHIQGLHYGRPWQAN